MVRFFVYPIEIYVYEQVQKHEPIAPYVALGIFGGFILTGFLIKTMVVRLIRKHV